MGAYPTPLCSPSLFCSSLSFPAVYVDVVHTDRGEEMLRLFRFGLIILLMVFFIGVNFVGFRSTGVNHVLIFEVNPRDNLPGLKIMEVRFLSVNSTRPALVYW